jgi:hypothetical protein
MPKEISRIRHLLTARGDYWDLSWDLPQLERAWRNEIVTIPVCYELHYDDCFFHSPFERTRVQRTSDTVIVITRPVTSIGISFQKL